MALEKPEWCPIDLWEETGMRFDELYDAEPDLEGGCEQGVRQYAAKIALKAQKDAYEECIEIAANKFTMDSVIKTGRGKPYKSGEIAIYCAQSISQAIRNKASEIK